MTNQKLSNFLEKFEKESNNIYTLPESVGYWSNLSKKENSEMISMLETHSTREAIMKTRPMIADVIFSEKRSVGLELLKLNGSETAIDLGCMWGAITIPLSKQVSEVLGVDQTIESLKFSEARVKEESLKNIKFLNANLRDLQLPDRTFDVAIVNGVLEWIPEIEEIELGDYWFKKIERKATGNPKEIQMAFLKNIHMGLKEGGRLMLAIENRYDYKMFFGTRDPHTGTFFTTIAPRWLANIISQIFRKREYRPWIYSFRGTEKLLREAGFSKVTLYSCWPDYRFPEFITPYGKINEFFRPTSSRVNGKRTFKRVVANRIEWVLFKVFNVQFFSPSIIAIAEK
jgi:SAM-dependent methyltransferase